MSAEPPGGVAVTLDPVEWQFLITALNGTSAMLRALFTLREAMPDSFQVPITSGAIVDIMALAEKIEAQTKSGPPDALDILNEANGS
jgi:hypothetical protein